MKEKVKDWGQHLTNNGAIKLVALFVALVLWLTILGRRDVVKIHNMNLDYALKSNQIIQNSVPEAMRVHLKGPRDVMNRFTAKLDTATLDLTEKEQGSHVIKLKRNLVDAPLGVKVLSIQPNRIKVVLETQDEKEL